VERLLLLWDELDELVGYGRHLTAGLVSRIKFSRRPAQRGSAVASDIQPLI
jgi:hypothetical protein